MRRVRGSETVSGAITRFVVAGLIALLVVGLGGVEILRQVGRSEAIRDSREVTRLAGEGIVAPAVSPGLVRGDPAAIARMDRVVRPRVLRDPVVRVKLWDASGRIVYSDQHRLIGQRYSLGDEERDALRTGRPDAEVSDVDRPENRYERGHGKLLEVYLGIDAPGGRRLLFETYQRYSSVASSGRRLWETFLPVLLGALVLLALLQLPFAVRLARRVQEGERERLVLLERALDAQQAERRRIAQDLHDGVVQTLAGLSFRLGADEQGVGRQIRETIRELRSLLVDIYPPSLQQEGLVAALSDLMTRARAPELRTELDAPEDLRLPPRTEALLFRAAQEALRNVVAHAEAENVRVAVARDNGVVRLTVTDDGRGFDPAQQRSAAEPGHFGLRALEDLVHDHGGSLSLDSAAGVGTTVRVEVPVA